MCLKGWTGIEERRIHHGGAEFAEVCAWRGPGGDRVIPAPGARSWKAKPPVHPPSAAPTPLAAPTPDRAEPPCLRVSVVNSAFSPTQPPIQTRQRTCEEDRSNQRASRSSVASTFSDNYQQTPDSPRRRGVRGGLRVERLWRPGASAPRSGEERGLRPPKERPRRGDDPVRATASPRVDPPRTPRLRGESGVCLYLSTDPESRTPTMGSLRWRVWKGG